LQNCLIYWRRFSESFAKTEQSNKRKCYIHGTKESWSKWYPEITILLLSKNAGWLKESGLAYITLDADSTIKSVCGNQEGAAKGLI
jgi:hypothetical protein